MSSEDTTLYEQLGGETKIRQLVDSFYRHMDTLPEARELRDMHEDLPRANMKLFEFLSGWTGGPDLFIQKYGHPRLRARHLPFKIGEKERDQWILCFRKALDECEIQGLVRTILEGSIVKLADHMRNQPSHL